MVKYLFFQHFRCIFEIFELNYFSFVLSTLYMKNCNIHFIESRENGTNKGNQNAPNKINRKLFSCAGDLDWLIENQSDKFSMSNLDRKIICRTPE